MKKNILLIIIVIALFAFPKVNFGQTINLGAASNFVLYTSGGAVHDNASSHSHLTGDIGYFTSGDFLGFGNVNGVMHPGVDVSTTACNTAVLNALAQINSTSNDYFPGLLLGNGVVFTPGVYSIPGNASLNLTLVLDAQNVPSAEFIIKVNGTLATNAGSKVKLVNGAQACNVYWKVEGVVSMATNTSMKGTIIANNAAINMATGDSLEGRLLCATAGAITIDGITAFTPQGCGSIVLTGPPHPPLGSIACYTIFSSNGALTNTIGTTTVIGDVGNNGIGAITGWTPAAVTGALHLIQDPSTIQAAVDLSNLYDTLNALVPDIELLYPAQFGHNLTLTPHVYVMNAAAIFTDSLYLDAQGNANGVFVIKIIAGSPALTTSTYSKVKLINGAQAKNVFWLIKGAVSINNYSVFRGTIVVPAGAINLINTGVVLDGRALTMVGAITTAGLAAAMPPGCGMLAPPIITLEPSNQITCIGGSVSFSVLASGGGLTYQWRKGNTILNNIGSISGATTSTLTINPAALSDAGNNYNVIVYGTSLPNDTSINVSLVVNTAPNITSQPTNQFACAGNSISFSVLAIGTNITYQWRKGVIPLSNIGNITGATSSVLTINPVSITDTSTKYNVIINGTCLPNDTSINVSLIVTTAPIIITQPTNKTICAGDSISFSEIATGTGLTYQWRKGNANLINTGNISGANTAVLTLNPASISDTSIKYNVIVFGACLPNDTSINVSLTVNTTPNIIIQPINQTACAGDAVSFSVGTTGIGLTYQWRKGTMYLNNVGNILGATSATLSINPSSIFDTASNYNVIVYGTCLPNDTSIYVSFTVNSAPIIITQPINQAICLGDSVSFVVVASGSNLTYQWRKGLINLINGINISGATNDTLTINPATLSDIATNYNVVVSGGCIAIDSASTGLTSAGGFGILASTAITSTGFSEIHNMDVGISPGVRSSITGFPPAVVIGGAIYASDDIAPPGVAAMLIQAKLDLTNAYLFAEGATYPAPVTIAGDQGGITLTPGIYKSTSSLLIQSGDLTLDAQGNMNAKWIFQVASDFTTIGGAGGNVILTGGAQANNITWQIGSSATIGNSTSFKGNILALTSITMNTGSSIDGRLLARNGAVVLSGTNIINGPSDSTSTILSQSISFNVSLAVNPIPAINSAPNSITCSGIAQNYSITSTIAGTTYNWSRTSVIGISNIGILNQTSNPITETLINTTLAPVNVIYLITPSANGCTGNPFSYTVTVNPSLQVSILIAASSNPVCIGTTVTFTATPTNGGTTPLYQWIVNGLNVGLNSSTYSYIPLNNDIITCILTSNTTPCATGNPNTSNVITMSTSSLLPVNVLISASSNPVCQNTTVTFNATPTNGGTNPSYQWKVNGLNVGINNSTYSYTPLNSDVITCVLTSNITPCATGNPDTSNSITMIITTNLPIGIVIVASLNPVCPGVSVTFTATPTNGGSITVYQWKVNSINVGINSTTYSYVPLNNDVVTCVLTSNIICSSGNPSTSNTITMIVYLAPTIPIINGPTPVCINQIDNIYTVQSGNSAYAWNIFGGGIITSGTNSNTIMVTWNVSGNQTVSVSYIDPNGCNSTTTNYTVLVNNCNADLSVIKTVDNAHPLIGHSVVFTIVATNNGPYDATGVIVSDLLQTGYTYVSSVASVGTYIPSTGIWTIGNLNNGASETLIMTVLVNSSGTYVNTATIIGSQPDDNSMNDVSVVEPSPTDFFIPEGYSPNGDGVNDMFVIRGIDFYTDNSIVIFNRWGNKVFEASPYQNTWNGKSTMGLRIGGDELPVGTYFYLLDLGDGSDIIKGTIYLNR